MATPLAPWTQRILNVLADGGWHHRDDLIAEGVKAVPPGRAFRVGERHRNAPGRRPNGPGPRVAGDDTDSIAAGARSLARDALNELARNNRVEQRNGHYQLTTKKKTTKQGATRT